MNVGATPSLQATTADSQGGGIRATKLAQDQLKTEGQAAVQLINAAAPTSAASPAPAAQGIDIRV
jgi:hypothetical protein